MNPEINSKKLLKNAKDNKEKIKNLEVTRKISGEQKKRKIQESINHYPKIIKIQKKTT